MAEPPESPGSPGNNGGADLFRAVVHESLDGIFVIDEDGVLVAWNRAEEDISGIPAERVLGRRALDLAEELVGPVVGEEMLEFIRARLRQALATGQADWLDGLNPGGDIRMSDMSGHERVVNIKSFSIPTARGHLLCSITREVTARARAEEEQRRMQQQMLEAQKTESLGVLAGGLAHDFNNLLMGVLGNADLALLDLPPESPLRHPLEQIEHAAQRAADLTRQMLAYAGQGRFLLERIDLDALVDEMSQLLRASVSRKARLLLDLHCALPLVEGDPTQLRQVVMNLLLNASEALGAGDGEIGLMTGIETLAANDLAGTFPAGARRAGDYVFLEVRDTGCGMDEATRRRMFDPFFSTKATGRGLGLAAVVGIVRSHHGLLRVESRSGRGTQIRLLFPALGPAPPPSVELALADDPALAAHGDGRLILVIDDEELVLETARALLERTGYRVLTAGDGRSGLERFRAHAEQIAAVLLDLSMPGMDGAEVLAELRRLSPEIPVLLSSGYSEQVVAERFRHLGLQGFVQKPYQLTELLVALDRGLAVRRTDPE